MKAVNEANPEVRESLLNLMAVSVVEVVNVEQPYDVGFYERRALPRARWVPCGISVRDGHEALEAILQDQESLEQVVWLETINLPIHSNCNLDQATEITIVDQQSNGIKMEIFTQSPGYVVLADTWYPGWRVWVDGQPETIWKANYLFKAIEIQLGNHRLELAYQPGLFIVGLVISCLALVGMSGLLLYLWRNSS